MEARYRWRYEEQARILSIPFKEELKSSLSCSPKQKKNKDKGSLSIDTRLQAVGNPANKDFSLYNRVSPPQSIEARKQKSSPKVVSRNLIKSPQVCQELYFMLRRLNKAP